MQKIAAISSLFFGGAFCVTLFLFKTDPDEFVALDTIASKTVLPLQAFTPSEFFLGITTLGSVIGVVLISIVVLIYLKTQKTLAMRLIGASLLSGLSVVVGKDIIGRVRPNGLPWLTELHSFSFPSGHTTAATTLYGFIAILVYCRVQNNAVRVTLLTLLLFIILGVGMSRIVLAAHYGSDVLAGFFLGAFSLSVAFIYPLTSPEKDYLQSRD